MQMCKDHWAKLKQAITDKGMAGLISADGEEAAEAMKNQLEGKPYKYDPLMDCTWMITGRALEEGGLYLMTVKEDGSDYCPLCEVDKHYEPGEAQKWIDGCTDAVLKHCQDEGLIPPVQ